MVSYKFSYKRIDNGSNLCPWCVADFILIFEYFEGLIGLHLFKIS